MPEVMLGYVFFVSNKNGPECLFCPSIVDFYGYPYVPGMDLRPDLKVWVMQQKVLSAALAGLHTEVLDNLDKVGGQIASSCQGWHQGNLDFVSSTKKYNV